MHIGCRNYLAPSLTSLAQRMFGELSLAGALPASGAIPSPIDPCFGGALVSPHEPKTQKPAATDRGGRNWNGGIRTWEYIPCQEAFCISMTPQC